MSSGEVIVPGPEVTLGSPLVGHTPWNVLAEEEGGDEKYWAQVIPSRFGDLRYAVGQYRDGTERWVTNHGEVQVVVVRGLDEPAVVQDIEMHPVHPWQDAEIYQVGLKEYREAHPKA